MQKAIRKRVGVMMMVKLRLSLVLELLSLVQYKVKGMITKGKKSLKM